ncbi:MAG: hypothetical protein JWM25_477 [Thermoleophilia bacterium]|nr:hypothetical protein [Thermoleophilia bacterium]
MRADCYRRQSDQSYSPPESDGANPSIPSGEGRFYRSIGDFMDGTAANHDRWVVVPLGQGTDFKNTNGTLNENSMFLNTLDCIQGKGWTPIAPAIYESTEEMRIRGRTFDADGNDVYRAIVYFGDGGGTSTPVRRTSSGAPTTTASWYTWTTGNRDRPCQDAIQQSDRAWANYGVHVYTIGYALNEGSAQACQQNSGAVESPAINARQTLDQMAHGDGKFYEAAAGDVTSIFREIGHAITAGGTRLVD